MGFSPYSYEARIFILVILLPGSAPLLARKHRQTIEILDEAVVTLLARRWNLLLPNRNC